MGLGTLKNEPRIEEMDRKIEKLQQPRNVKKKIGLIQNQGDLHQEGIDLDVNPNEDQT